jgi:hypothetical protein
MARRPLTRPWSAEELARLIELADSGATVTRASAVLGRRLNSVQEKARRLGKPLIGTLAQRAAMRPPDDIRTDDH